MQRFQHKNVIISGASSGIGRATAHRIAKEGGNLGIFDINLERLKKTASELQAYGNQVCYLQCDVTNFDETSQVIDHLYHELGGIHALSHNAGILRCYHTHEMTLAEWNEVLAVNLTGTFNVNRHAIPHLLKNERSYIVNTSSIAADQPHPWMSAYAATKGAIKSFTRSIFIEYALQGLHANCVMPGSIKSDLADTFMVPTGANRDLVKTLIPLGESKPVSPDHVASVIAMLASDDAMHINGTEIVVDGGRIY
jgi:NAD(P)-dependent dehydrogenase (short-subunit alcohol dehydrogenase family)